MTRKPVQDILLSGIREDLTDPAPAVIDEFEKRVPAALRRAEKPKADQHQKIAQLEGEIGNLTDAIANGLLRSSPALAQRLAKAELAGAGCPAGKAAQHCRAQHCRAKCPLALARNGGGAG